MSHPTFQEYNPKWPNDFLKEKEILENALKNTAIEINHVGSTAIPGMPGKGIIDILVTVRDLEPNNAYKEPLENLGYIERPVPRTESPFFTKPSVKPRTYNVHIAIHESERHKDLISFRDFLLSNPDQAKLYEEAKRKLAQSNPNDWEFYSHKKAEIAEELSQKAKTYSKTKH